MKSGFPGPGPREGWSTQGPARPCVTPGARSQPRQGQVRRRAGREPGPGSPASWKGRPALSDPGSLPCPVSHGPRRGGLLPNLLQTVWSPGLPPSRLLGAPSLQGMPCFMFSWTSEWSFWLWVEKQRLSQRLAGRCSWERCWLSALDQRLLGAGEGAEAAPSGVPACRSGFVGDAAMTSRWPGCQEGLWRVQAPTQQRWPCAPCPPLATVSPCWVPDCELRWPARLQGSQTLFQGGSSPVSCPTDSSSHLQNPSLNLFPKACCCFLKPEVTSGRSGGFSGVLGRGE